MQASMTVKITITWSLNVFINSMSMERSPFSAKNQTL